MSDDRRGDGEGRERREPRLRDLARRFLEGEEGAHEERPRPEERTRMDAREMLGAVLETGDKAKTEVVRMVAREVRAYLEALELGEDIRDLLTNYSLEVNASFSLKPLRDTEAEDTPVRAKRRRARKARAAAAADEEEPASE